MFVCAEILYGITIAAYTFAAVRGTITCTSVPVGLQLA